MSASDTFLREALRRVDAAATRIAPHARRTPLLDTGIEGVRVKAECLQRTGSFKLRGAFNTVLRLLERGERPRGFLAISSGNHGQAVAFAAATVGLPAIVIVPQDAPADKIAAIRAYGAEVRCDGVTMRNRDEIAAATLASSGFTLIHPHDNWDVVDGQGTLALEILQEWPQVDLIVAPLGGGGLVAGVLCAAKAVHPNTRVVGVEPEEAADARDSLRSGQLVRREAGATIADGVRPPSLGTPGFEVIVRRRLIDDIVTVTESQIGAAVAFALRRLHLVVEPSGALPLAALHAGLLPSSRATALVLSGGNLDWPLAFRLLQAHRDN